MKLLQTSILSAFSVAAKVLMGLIVMKFAAVYIGATGIALVGQFQTLLNIVAVISGGGITIGVIKYIAEYKNNIHEFSSLLSTAFIYTLCFSLLTMITSLFFAKEIALLIFGSMSYDYLIYILSIVQFFIAFNLLGNAVYNGLRQIKILTKINIFSAFLSCCFVISLMVYSGLKGALIALIIVQLFPFCFFLFYICKEKWKKHFILFKFDKIKAKKLFSYSMMVLVSALSLPLAQIFVRNDLAHLFSWEAVGYWQAVLRISDAYLVLVTTIFSAYYLPKLSEISNISSIKKEILITAKFIVPAFFIVLFLIYLLRKPIVTILYTRDFYPALELFLWQLVGDFFRMSGLLCTYFLLAKSHIKLYISTELILSISFIISEHFLVRKFGLIGVTYAFTCMGLIYFLMMSGILFLLIKGKQSEHIGVLH